MYYNIIVFSQHLKLHSLKSVISDLPKEDRFIFVTTHMLFKNEKALIYSLYPNSLFFCFADLLSDSEMASCDVEADVVTNTNMADYYELIKEKKNQAIVKRINDEYEIKKGILLSNDLGIEEKVWLEYGFEKRDGEYYWKETAKSKKNSTFKTYINLFKKESYVAHKDGKIYVFYGRLSRIGYRLTLDFKRSKWEGFMYGLDHVFLRLFRKTIYRDITRLTTFHEFNSVGKNTPLKVLQDGYLPPNYSSEYMKYYPGDIEFYTWDKMSLQTFINHNLPCRITPFRKKLYLPEAVFPKEVKKVLCVSSGAGDWTAVKNRSDEDRMIEAFVEVARKFPNIEFVYRCHPVWVIPQHQGVNSINRVIEYFDSLNLPNLKVSSNIPAAFQDGKMVLSYQRTSLEDDLKNVDVVFGEHSISMIDGAFKGIVFSSVNTTGRRNFFQSITDLGFPHCETVEEICDMINSVTTSEFQERYSQAIRNYNEMTDQD